MKLLLPFLMSLNVLVGQALQDCPTSSGWSSAASICYRIVHFPESFWAAKAWCKAVKGELLSLENVEQIKEQVKTSMQGNAGDYRIDGWADGQWFHKSNESLVSSDYELLHALDEKTLTVNLQDWQVTGDTEIGTRLGFICEGKAEELSGTCAEATVILTPLGCFPSSACGGFSKSMDISDPEMCLAICEERGDAYAGVIGVECYCSSTDPSLSGQETNAGTCVNDCDNRGYEKCGKTSSPRHCNVFVKNA